MEPIEGPPDDDAAASPVEEPAEAGEGQLVASPDPSAPAGGDEEGAPALEFAAAAAADYSGGEAVGEEAGADPGVDEEAAEEESVERDSEEEMEPLGEEGIKGEAEGSEPFVDSEAAGEDEEEEEGMERDEEESEPFDKAEAVKEEEGMGTALEEAEEPVVDAEAVGDDNMETAAEEVEEPLVDAQKVEEEGVEMATEEPELEPQPEPEPASVDVASTGTGKRKRGRPPKKNKAQTVRPPAKKKEEEDVCFVCFDGGNLVVCDRRGCPKAYHPPCVNRDESFFETSGRWTCGWHLCSVCEKAVHYMCYTCTYSLCKGCIKEAGFLCIRGNKGFCESCYRTVKLIELEQHTNEEKVGLDFDDKSSFNYLFKEYWFDLKRKLSITLEELNSAKNPWKGSGASTRHGESSDELYDANAELEDNSDSSSGRHEVSNSSRKKVRRRPRAAADEDSSVTQNECEGNSMPGDDKWATPALLEFVAHMKGGDESAVSQFDVQELLLSYITRNKLRDPRRKSQIICDSRLQNLFGKARVGHFEMLKLIESHFLLKEASQVVTEENQEGVVDPDFSQADAEGYHDAATKMGSDKRRKIRKRVEEREPQTNLDEYAAIDVHNIKLIYLRRNLVEDLLDDIHTFNEKIVNSFVRIRISGADQRQDLYRLVQVVGAQKTAETYKTGRRTTDIKLEIVNLNKLEVITIDSISNQEFAEEECKRLRQSIKLGLINRLTVGDIQEKARVLQAVRVNDWLESEKLRLGHLRDRASETGRRKELRECVEKLQLLSTPEERRRRLNEVPDIHTDPRMNPEYESDDEGETGDKNQDSYKRSRESSFLRKGREAISPGRGGPAANWGVSRKSSNTYRETSREGPRDKLDQYSTGSRTNEFSWNQGKDVNQTGSWDATQTQTNAAVSDSVWNSNQPALSPRQPYGVAQETSPASLPTGDLLSSNICDENEKIWNYRDPSGKLQGPFSMTQLRKWSTTGYFPPDLRIWRVSENQEDSILLTDALNGNFEKDLPQWEPQTTLPSAWPAPRPEVATPRGGKIGISPKGWELSKDANAWSGQPQGHGSHSYDRQHSKWSSSSQQAFGDHLNVQSSNNSRNQWGNDSFNLLTPTPQLSSRGWHAAQGTMEHKVAAPVVNSLGGWGSRSSPPSCTDSSMNDLGGGLNKKQFFESDCPSPTPSERQEHPTLQHSEGNMSPIACAVDRTNRPTRSAMPTVESSALESTSGQQQDPNRWEHDQTQKPEPISSGPSDTVVGEWSLPSPTPSTKPSTWNTIADSKPLVSSNGSRQAASSQPQVSTPTEPAQAGWGTSTVAGPAQGNANWGIAIQGNTNVGWGAMAQGNANGAWATPAQGNPNVTAGLGAAASQGSIGWGAPQGNTNASTGWGMPMQGNLNPNVGWGAPAPIPAAGNLNPGWAQPMQGVPNQISPVMNATGWGTGLVNANAGWGSPAGNPNSFSPQQTQNGEWHRGGRSGDSGHSGGRNDRTQHGNGGSSRPPPRGQGQRSGICKFHENGHCRKGASCNYIHS